MAGSQPQTPKDAIRFHWKAGEEQLVELPLAIHGYQLSAAVTIEFDDDLLGGSWTWCVERVGIDHPGDDLRIMPDDSAGLAAFAELLEAIRNSLNDMTLSAFIAVTGHDPFEGQPIRPKYAPLHRIGGAS